jgi:lycopene cyclase domain-containing protein
MSYYGYILLFAFLGPLALSFDKKVAYYKRLRHLIIPIVLVSGLFLIWDQWFTEKGVWGFTLVHTAGLYLGRLPLEEVLFFVIVPYNCMFIFEVIGAYFQPKNKALRIFWGIFAARVKLIDAATYGLVYTFCRSTRDVTQRYPADL